jgi:hypothetical protein
MVEIRMSLADAAATLGIAPNSVRSRFKAGKLRGERDNQGKIWVWLDDSAQLVDGSKSNPSKPSIEGSEKAHIKALEAHLQTLMKQLDLTQAEISTLRLRASVADSLEAQVAGLETLREEIGADRDRWREMAEQALADRRQEPEPRKGLWSRLLGR